MFVDLSFFAFEMFWLFFSRPTSPKVNVQCVYVSEISFIFNPSEVFLPRDR